MSENELPLYNLFTNLRIAGFPIGVGDYNLLLQVLLADYGTIEETLLHIGIPNLSSLKQLCQTLWVKSASQRLQFEVIFNQVFTETTKIDDDLKESIKEENPPYSKLNSGGNEEKEQTQTVKPGEEKPDQKPEEKKEYFYFPPTSNIEPLENEQMAEGEKIVKAFKTGKPRDCVSFKPSGIVDEYLPVTTQQMQQAWYTLRHPIREGSRLELDIPATIDQVNRRGKFFHPIQKPSQVKSRQLVLLIDQKGSMQPFHILSRLLVETALQAGCLEKNNCYYFNNYPRHVLYGEPEFMTEIPMNQFMTHLNFHRSVILIFSDAGSARGDYVSKRIRETIKFVGKLRQYSKAITWLNPMPKDVWDRTTANAIANSNIVQMFPVDYSGFQNAIASLQ